MIRIALFSLLLFCFSGCTNRSTVAEPTAAPTASATYTAANCPQTPYVSARPPDENTARLTNTWYANEWLWAGLVPPYKGVWYAGGVKVGWWRSVVGKLSIEGLRLNAPAPPLRADIPDGYGLSGFQATSIDFPTEGCWEVIGRVADKSLRFVVQVHPASENPTRQPTPIMTPTPPRTATGLSDLKVPTPQPGYFWANDEPKELPPFAFGVLDPDSRQAGAAGTIRTDELSVPLFNAPKDLDVYLVGDYPPNHCAVLLGIVKSLQGWDCIPLYSLVQYTPAQPLGEKMVTVTKEAIVQRAVQLLQERGLLLPDQAMPKAYGLSRVFFLQRINGVPVYANKNLAVAFNVDGQATNIIGRRRPLLARSRYPLRLPEEAWKMLMEGRRRGFFVDTGYEPVQPTAVQSEPIERFVAMELAYVEGEVINPQEVMQPYYVFRGEQGQAFFVPAVADPYVRWP